MARPARYRLTVLLLAMAGFCAAGCGVHAHAEGPSGPSPSISPPPEECLPPVETASDHVRVGQRVTVYAGPSDCGRIYPHPISYDIAVYNTPDGENGYELGTVQAGRDGSFRLAARVPKGLQPGSAMVIVYAPPLTYCPQGVCGYGYATGITITPVGDRSDV